MRFSELIGQEDIRQHLQNALRHQAVSHAYLISGETGMGKRTIARLFAQALQCTDLQEKDGVLEPCCKCTACTQVMNDAHPDIRTITPVKTTAIGVGDIREQLVEDSYLMPYAGERKIYIVPDAQNMTPEAQNALLKTLEEPPKYVVILLLSNNDTAFLPTVLSRVVSLPLKPVPDEAVRDYLMQKLRVPDYQAHLAVRFAQGNIGRAALLAKGDDFQSLLRRTTGLLQDLDTMPVHRMNAEMAAIMTPEDTDEKPDKAAKKAYERRAVDDFLNILTALLRDMLVYKASGREDLLIFAGEMSYISKACEHLSYADIARSQEEIARAEAQLRANGNTELILQLLLMNLKERIAYT